MKKQSKITQQLRPWLIFTACLGLIAFAGEAAAGGADNLGDMAKNITDTFKQVGDLITGGSYLAGVGFSIAAIMKFKQHKDNPTQITVGTPIALVFIAAALLFLPTILQVAGGTMFGGSYETAGPGGTEIKGK